MPGSRRSEEQAVHSAVVHLRAAGLVIAVAGHELMLDETAEPMDEMEEAQETGADPVAFVRAVSEADNLVSMLTDEQRTTIANDCLRDYEADKESMSEWLGRMEDAIKLANLVRSEKDYPFVGASNIKYPLVTTAALQFNARAYPAIVPADDVVKVKTYGNDAQGMKAARAKRVGGYMSWQMLNELKEWDQDTDRLLMQLPIVGDMFRKVWFNGERAETRLIQPGKFIVNDGATSLDAAPRCTEEIDLYPYEVQEREASGRFEEVEYPMEGEDKQFPRAFIEQHCRIDLDEDGYPEPYIATVHIDTRKLVRLAADFTGEDVAFVTEAQPVMVQGPYGPTMGQQEVPTGITKIARRSYFVHYQFAPGITGKFWGMGLGFLLGDISAAINSTFNLLMDAGHYSSLGGGFIGAEFRIAGGAKRRRPGEWSQVNVPGGDVRSAMIPFTTPGPDATLFQMLGLLIEAGKEVASVKDIMTGETATNMQPTTVMALIEQGMKMFTASYKRIFRALKCEFSLIARINAETLSPEKYSAFHDEQADPRADFTETGTDVQPVADPASVTKMQQMAKGQLLMDMAKTGMVDPAEASNRVLEAADIENREALVPKQDPMMQQMQMASAQIGLEMQMADLAQKRAEIELTIAKIESEQAAAVKDLTDAASNERQTSILAVRAMLEETGRDMDRAIARGRAGMAGAPGNGGAPSGNGIRAGGPQGGIPGGILGGQAAPGNGSGGAAPDGGVPSGLL